MPLIINPLTSSLLGGGQEPEDGVNVLIEGVDAGAGDGVAKELHCGAGQDALLYVDDKPGLAEAVEDLSEVALMFLEGPAGH